VVIGAVAVPGGLLILAGGGHDAGGLLGGYTRQLREAPDAIRHLAQGHPAGNVVMTV
jgi:hypothetical protein